jgi:exodeoxyribonuclease VII large subunit
LKKGLNAIKQKTQSYRRDLKRIRSSRVFLVPGQALNIRRQELDLLRERVVRHLRQDLFFKREQYCRVLGKLDALSPLATLSRGYSITQKADGTFIKQIDQTEIGERVKVTLATGFLSCEVRDKGSQNE